MNWFKKLFEKDDNWKIEFDNGQKTIEVDITKEQLNVIIDIYENIEKKTHKQVAKGIFDDLEKKRDIHWKVGRKHGLKERVEFLKEDFDEVKNEWTGNKELKMKRRVVVW